jgi:hypothetical protein
MAMIGMSGAVLLEPAKVGSVEYYLKEFYEYF